MELHLCLESGMSYFDKEYRAVKKVYEHHFSARVYSTHYASGPETSQTVGGVGFGVGDFSVAYEND